MIENKTKSILDELFLNETDYSLLEFESRADHILNSVINLFEMIQNLPVSDQEKSDIEKRIFLCIKHRDSKKFNKYISLLRKKYEKY